MSETNEYKPRNAGVFWRPGFYEGMSEEERIKVEETSKKEWEMLLNNLESAQKLESYYKKKLNQISYGIFLIAGMLLTYFLFKYL